MRMYDQEPIAGNGGAGSQPESADIKNKTGTFLLTRRQVLQQWSAGALLTLGLWPGCAHLDGSSAKSFRFLVVNDTHLMSPECEVWLERVIQQMKAHGDVEFCLLAGDLTEHGKKEDLGAVREIVGGLGRPVYVVIGNHDYESPDSRVSYEQMFPRRLNYVFRHRGWQFVGLDTTEGQKYERTRVQSATLRWLDDHLHWLSKTKPTVVFTHFPLGGGVAYRPLNADAVLERFKPYNLRAVFCGHFHGFTARSVGSALATTNRCCALKRGNHDQSKRKGYFLCTATGGSIFREFITVSQAAEKTARSA